jgi:hypothetical protein
MPAYGQEWRKDFYPRTVTNSFTFVQLVPVMPMPRAAICNWRAAGGGV